MPTEKEKKEALALKRSRAAKKASRKGKQGEYEVRDILSELFYSSGGGACHKTPLSGAWGGMPILSGDLVCITDKGLIDTRLPFFWEVKFRARREFTPYRYLAGEFGILKDWYEVEKKKCARNQGNLLPLLVWRANETPWFVFMDIGAFMLLEDSLGMYGYGGKVESVWEHEEAEDGYVMIPLKDFCKWFEKSGFLKQT